MRIGIFVRTAITIFFNVSACCGATSHTRRDNRTNTLNTLDAAATIDIIPTRAKAIDGVHENDKNDEARVITSGAVHMIDPNVEKGEMIAKYSSDLKEFLKLGTQTSLKNIAKVMEHEHWASMIKETDDWLLKQHVNPKIVFSYLKLESIFTQDMDIDTISHDPKLLLWFRYIIEYRKMDSTGLNFAPFNDKELFGLLVAIIEARSLKLTLSFHDNPLPDPRLQVVKLFEVYRNEPSMKSFATDMLTYMVTDSSTQDHVLNQWLRKKESLITVFSVLHLNDEHGRVDLDDMTLFSAWLKYIKMNFQSGDSKFLNRDFVGLQLSMMSVPRARAMFQSNALEHVLGDVEHKFGNLAAYLRDIWQRFPFHLFRSGKLEGKRITDDNKVDFLKAISLVALHMDTMPFNGAIVYELLKPVYSLDEMTMMFKTLKYQANHFEILTVRRRIVLEKLADKMVQYLIRLSQLHSVFKLPPEESWIHLLQEGVDADILMIWFKFSVLYYSRRENSVENAMITALTALLEKIKKKETSLKLWDTALEGLREKDPPLWKMLVHHMPRSRKRKTRPT